MCLALPAKVVSMTGSDKAIVSLGDVEKEISLALVDKVNVGDYVLLHVGYALNKINTEEAEKTLALFQQAGLIVGESE